MVARAHQGPDRQLRVSLDKTLGSATHQPAELPGHTVHHVFLLCVDGDTKPRGEVTGHCHTAESKYRSNTAACVLYHITCQSLLNFLMSPSLVSPQTTPQG